MAVLRGGVRAGEPGRPFRIAFLTSGMTGYLDAELSAMADRGVEMFVAVRSYRENVAYDEFEIPNRSQYWEWHDDPDPDDAVARVEAFAPDAILMHSWEFKPYRAVMKAFQSRAVRVLWMDNNWLETPKQWLGRATSRWYLHPVFDAAFVPGERTEAFARRLGYTGPTVIRGSLTANTSLFGAEPVSGAELQARGRFLSALRLVEHKGADLLAEAYALYRDLVDDPWGLDVVGIGELASTLEGLDGVKMHGFVQPPGVASLMREVSCYVNPSRVEPYGVVLHEAAASSLPILTSEWVGAAPTLVQDGGNGWSVTSGSARALAEAMARISTLDDDRLGEMSRVSHALAQRLSPAAWARNLHEELVRLAR